MFRRLTESVLDHPRRYGLLVFAIFAGSLWGASRLRIDFSTRSFFSNEDTALEVLDRSQAMWGADDAIVPVAVTGSAILTKEGIYSLNETAEALRALPFVASVRALPDTVALAGQNPGELVMDTVLATVPDRMENRSQWRARLLRADHLVPQLLAEDGSATLMLVALKGKIQDSIKLIPQIEEIRATLARMEASSELRFQAGGVPTIRADVNRTTHRDQAIIVPLSFLLMCLLLWTVFRRAHGVLVPLIAAIAPVVVLFGIMGFCGEPIGSLNQTFTTLLPAIAVADAIHLVSRFHEELGARAGPGSNFASVRRAALISTVKHIGVACLLTSLTTGVGFLSLRAASMPVLKSFGTYAALGVALAYLSVLILTPLCLSRVRCAPPANRNQRLFSSLARVSIQRSAWVLGGTLLLTIASIGFGARVTADQKFTALFNRTHPSRQASITIDHALSGSLNLEIDLFASPEGALLTPEVLDKLWRLERWARKQPGVRTTQGPGSYVAQLHRLIVGRHDIPNTRSAIAQLLLLTEGDSSRDGWLSPNAKRGRIIVRTQDLGANAFTHLAQRTKRKAQSELSGLPVEAHVTGAPYVSYRGVSNVTNDLKDSLLLACLVIVAMIGLLLRSPRLALLCLVPNVLPLLLGYGFLGFMGWSLNPSRAIVFTLGLGIAVDDTLHLIVRFREELARGRPLAHSLERAVSQCGRAAALTTVILVVAFSLNMLSSFVELFAMGALGAVVISSALLCDVIVLPALLWRFSDR